MRIRLGHSYTGTEIARILGAPAPERDATVTHLCTDTRELSRGDLFVCLRGERYDGHAYLSPAREMGAALILSEVPYTGAITVPDTYAALAALAADMRARVRPRVIAVTGSVGKTTTKELIAAVLAKEYPTHKTAGNQNNLLGLCLTLLSMPQGTRYLVAELGMNHAREIAPLSCLLRPDIAVITNVGQAHIGELGSRAAIARAKLEILEGCDPGALYFYPAEEPLLAAPCSAGVIPFPIAHGRGGDHAYFDVTPGDGYTRFSLDFRRWRYEGLRVRGVGAHLAACAAYAVSIGDIMGVSHEGIEDALLSFDTPGLRQEICEAGGVTVINDAYNASPESMEAALASLSHIQEKKGGRAFALLGEMRELGDFSQELHAALGKSCAARGLTRLFLLGPSCLTVARGARDAGMEEDRIVLLEESSPRLCAESIVNELLPRDCLLVKASRQVGAERVAEEIISFLKERGGCL